MQHRQGWCRSLLSILVGSMLTSQVIPPWPTQHCAPALVQGPLGCKMVVFIPGIPMLTLGPLWEHPSQPERGQVPAAPQQVPILEAAGKTAALMISLPPQASPHVTLPLPAAVT